MKYTKEQYEQGKYFGSKDTTIKLVKVRKPHECILCNTTIRPNESAIYEKALMRGLGWNDCYICIGCADQWLEATKQIKGVNINETNI